MGRLLPWQVRDIYFHPVDDLGRIKLPGEDKSKAEKLMAIFVALHRKAGKTDEEIGVLWEQFLVRSIEGGSALPSGV